MEIIILDLFGGSGGVGRCTRELLRQLEMEQVSTMLCGRSHVVDSLKIHQAATRFIQYANLERPRFWPGAIKIKLAAKSSPDSVRLADTLLKESHKSAARQGATRSILVNYPQVIAPPSQPGNFCVFLHDLNWRLYPGNFFDPDRTDRNCRGWVERAVKVITNSECTRDEVIEHYQCAPEKVVAAPLAPFGVKIAQAFDAEKYLTNLGLVASRFYLYPGVWGLHKGHDTLTAALELAKSTDPIVVTCGMPLDGITNSMGAVATKRRTLVDRWARLIAVKKLVVVHNITDLEMQALRDGCRAYVLPSAYEGFGFPLVEAIYHHCPAIVSDIKAHREILNRYQQYKLATLFDSKSSEALAAELEHVSLNSTPMSKDWHKSVDATWSWKNTVRQILSALGPVK